MNYFAKTVYSIATKPCPLLSTDAFHRQKVRGPKWVLLKSGGGHGPLPPPSLVPPPLYDNE